ncbi:hypothetical protein [Streptomyces sp. MUM 178J]|uniref:hypothetical protein n=1 Tax=Streptomyces sp. MUM 178J TaxID=2791991 RepID=UPI001F04C96E|nr:hypothetical protein [Streptomyces sp. MUM 178J]WRQ81736.1 hypothetical protein I3F59_021570 [Streptomyces sp. MUM 178J]
MTPHSLAFYMDVVASGAVLGAKPTDSPGRVTAILGSDFAENSFDDHSMWRDYGMAEFFWTRESPDHAWEGHHFTLQVHRLAHWGGSVVNRAIRNRYGRFDRHLRFGKLERLLRKRGVPLEDVPDVNAPAFTQHWQPASQVSVRVFRAHDEWRQRRRSDSRIGDVHAIHSSVSAEEVAWSRERYGRQDLMSGASRMNRGHPTP